MQIVNNEHNIIHKQSVYVCVNVVIEALYSYHLDIIWMQINTYPQYLIGLPICNPFVYMVVL